MSDVIAEILEEELAALAKPSSSGQAPASAGDWPGTQREPQVVGRAPISELRDQLLLARGGPGVTAAVQPVAAFSMDTVIVSSTGGVFLVGWCDDTLDPIDVVRVTGTGWRVAFDGAGLARIRRRDVEGALGSTQVASYGFWGFVYGKHPINTRGVCTVEVTLRSGAAQAIRVDLRAVEETELRGVVLTYLTTSEWYGAGQVESIACLETVIGRQILSLNAAISRRIVEQPYVERFISGRRAPRASIVVCLYGKPEYLFLQNAAFFSTPGMEDYELVYVSNSPELAERLIKETRNAHLVYGVDHTLVLLNDNAGFGAANNIAVQHARSDRILIVNPDVFPADPNWAIQHAEVVNNLPAEQSRLFGVPLYYNDGSLMHGGMYFDVDTGLSLTANGVRRRRLVRVEHYGKGAPPNTEAFTHARPVPAVTGAFISLDRAWYETLGGFTEEYVFGHYEDADLCLKSLREGTPAWMHDIRMWHLEGKGSTRLPVHEGGSTVNRWLFSDTWLEMVENGLIGPAPTHPAFAPLVDPMTAVSVSESASAVTEPEAEAIMVETAWKRSRRIRAARVGG